MSTVTNDLFGAVLVGIGATLFMDLWAVLLKRVFRFPSPNYCLVGRWVSYMPGGTFRHASIGASPHKPSECAIGWAVHYIVGVAYALILVALAPRSWLAEPTLLPALLFGVGTVLVPFLVMQPSFGMGIAASRTPHPKEARLRSLMAHSAFGVGLYVCALGLSHALGIDA